MTEIVSNSRKTIPPYAALRAFEAFGRLKSMRKAAADLSLHHAVVSRHVNALEEWVGVTLVDRENRDRCLTVEGERFHGRIAAAIADLADATAEVMHLDEHVRLSVCANGGFAARWLGPRIIQFNAEHPALSVELRPTDQTPDLSRHEADVDIRFYGDAYATIPTKKGVRHAVLARPPIHVIGAPRLVERLQGQPAEALLRETLLHEEHDAQWRAWFAANGVAAPETIPGARLWHAHIAIDAAIDGKGFALASKFLVRDEIADERLSVFSPADNAAAAPLGAYLIFAREDRWNAPSISQLRQWLKRQSDATPSL